jgi:hypothetical protein
VNNKKLPKEVVDHWPEVFEDVEVEVIPVKYLYSIRITFEDGITWDVSIDKNSTDNDVETAIEEVLEEYEDTISSIDFRLDTEKVKRDISKRTHIFMKKRR